jgi:hypothetical protein
MQNLFSERAFFDWLQGISAMYGEAMAAWGQAAQRAAASGTSEELLTATDSALESLVSGLMDIGRQHDVRGVPEQGTLVLVSLDRLLGGSVEFLEDARVRLREGGIVSLAELAPRVGELRALEAEVERATGAMQDKLDDTFGEPGRPER